MKHAARMGILALALCCLAAAGPWADTYDTHTLVNITTTNEKDVRFLYDHRLDVVGRSGDVYKALLTDKELDLVRKRGMKVEVLHDEMAAERASRAVPGFCTNTAWPCYYAPTTFDMSSPPAGTVMDFLLGLYNANPTITRLYDIGDSEDGNYDIIAMKVTDNPDIEENEPELRIYGNIHGDEASALMVPCDVLETILTRYASSDPDAVKLVEESEMWFIPCGNPWGLANESRENSSGVDLNRNFWGPAGHSSGSSAFSEAETQAIRDLTEVLGKRFVVSMSYHSGAICFNSVYNYTLTPTSDEPVFFTSWTGGPNGGAQPAPDGLAQAYYDGNTTSGFWYTNGADWYETYGDTNDWSYYLWSDLDTTIELTTTKWPDSSLIPTYTAEHREASINYLLEAFQGVSGLMTDSSSGLPLDGTVIATCTASSTITTPHEYKEVLTDPDVGDYHRVLQPGTYTVECRAPGYAPQITTGLVVTADSTTICNCQLGCIPLNISSVQVADITADSATITWTTDADADSSVTYGTSTPPGTTEYDAAEVMSHSVTVSGLAPCTDYYFSVTSGSTGCSLETDDNGGAYYTFTTYSDNALLRDDMESGSGNWTADTPWALSTESSHGGSTAWSDSPGGDYGSGIDTSLTCLPIDLSGSTGTSMTFWHIYEFESGYDYGHVEVSTNGSSWTELETFDGTQTSWTQESYDLSAYDGEPVFYVRFRVTSDSNTEFDGWHIDDVVLGPPGGPCGPHAAYDGDHQAIDDDCASGGAGDGDGIWDAGESVNFWVDITNDGSEDLTGVSATVTSTTPGVVLTDSLSAYPDLPQGTGNTCSGDCFTVQLPASLSCGDTVDFEISISADQGGPWSDSFGREVGEMVIGGGTLLTEDFDSASAPDLPSGWAAVDVSGTAGEWATDTDTVHPSSGGTYSGANLAYFNSYTASSGNSTRLYSTTGFSVPGAATACDLTFWMYHDAGYSYADDTVQPQISLNGTSWTDTGAAVSRNDGSTGWWQHTVSLDGYIGEATVYVGFLATSDYGNDCHIDEVAVTYTAPSGCNMNPCAVSCGMTVDVTPDGTTQACEGQDVVFTANLTGGTGPFSYQWTRDGGDISGATSGTLTENFGTAQSHDYNCKVSDSSSCTDVEDAADAAGEWVVCAVSPPPAPDGSGTTTPLTAERLTTSGGEIEVSWDASSCPATDYMLIFGELADVSSYGLSGGECAIGTSGSHSWESVPAGDHYFLILGTDGVDTESSWGADSSSNERNGSTHSGLCGMTSKDTTATCP